VGCGTLKESRRAACEDWPANQEAVESKVGVRLGIDSRSSGTRLGCKNGKTSRHDRHADKASSSRERSPQNADEGWQSKQLQLEGKNAAVMLERTVTTQAAHTSHARELERPHTISATPRPHHNGGPHAWAISPGDIHQQRQSNTPPYAAPRAAETGANIISPADACSTASTGRGAGQPSRATPP